MTKRKESRRPERQITPYDILGILLILLFLFGLPSFLLNLNSPEEPGRYSSYAGPILPMSSLSGGEKVAVSREVTLDFGIYMEEREFRSDPERVVVTDAYTLANPSAEPVTVELVWGFETRFAEDAPVITVDGLPAEATVWRSTDNDGKVAHADSFEAYRGALTDIDYLAEAMAEVVPWNVPVKVYHFHSMSYEGDGENPPMLDIAYKYGKTTNLWVRTYSAAGYDGKDYHLAFDIGQDAWLYVVGDDLEDMTIGGIKVHTQGVYQAKEVEGLTYELEIYDSTFDQCLWEAAQAYQYDWEENPGSGAELVTPEMLYNGAMKAIVAQGESLPGDVDSMDSRFGGVYNGLRMIYWVFPVEIPANGSVTVSGIYEKQSSCNFGDDRHGYDIATALGSNLCFSEQRVNLVNTHLVTIAGEGEAQNFGFDPAKGVTTVMLDQTVERYFLDLLIAEEQN